MYQGYRGIGGALGSRLMGAFLLTFLFCQSLFAGPFVQGRVSVVMTTYNRSGLVLHAIDSILKQTYPDFELIIVDDASTDGGFERIKESVYDDRVRLYRLNQNVGMYAASNYALKHWVRGEFVTWQDSDDLSHPERLRRQVDHIQTHPIDAVSIPHFNVETNRITYGAFPEAQGPQPELPVLRRYSSRRDDFNFSMTRGLFRTTRVMEIGGFNGRNRISMDMDFANRFIRLFPSGGTPGDEPLYYYSPRPDSLTVSPATNFRSLARRLVTMKILGDRCASLVLWKAGMTEQFRSRQIQDMYYPPGLEAVERWVPLKVLAEAN